MLTLRPYQQAAVAAIYGYFEVRSGHPLIVIPTAGGKALVMAALRSDKVSDAERAEIQQFLEDTRDE